MQTIRLRVNEKIYERLLLQLGKFDSNKLEIITENKSFYENQEFLQSILMARKLEI